MHAADCVLMRNDIADVAVCLHLSRKVFQRIKQNFMWATIYNFMAIPFAAGCWYPYTRTSLPPQWAGFFMAFSSVSVVLSSLALRLYVIVMRIDSRLS